MATKSAIDIADVCRLAKDKLLSLGIEMELVSELEWCIGSYEHDKNSAGLISKGKEALKALTKVHNAQPKKVTKTLLTSLEKATGGK